MSQCPCGSDRSFDDCCAPFLSGAAVAPTAEALMRSRYTAYTKGDVEYVERTHLPATRDGFDRASAERWMSGSDWLGLTICGTEAGGPDDDAGVVEFECRYRMDGAIHTHREISRFVRVEGAWFFEDGVLAPRTRTAPKAGRNDPCPCGSGKKYKKCCGA